MNPCRYGTRQDGRLGSVEDTLVAERLDTALVVTFEQRPRRERQVPPYPQAPAAGDAPSSKCNSLRLSALAMFLVSSGTLADQEVTSLASLIRSWLPQAGVAGMWRFTAATST